MKAALPRVARRLVRFALLMGLVNWQAAALGAQDPDDYLSSLRTVRAAIGDEGFELWVARTPDQRSRGLKDVTAEMLAPAPGGDWRGMLFVFAEDGVPTFWMEGTLTGLDIAFIDRDWQVASIRTMLPDTRISHAPRTPVRYAIEVQAGLLERLGIRPGEKVRIRFPGLPKE